MEYGNAGFSSADGERSWRVDQRPGQSIRVAQWRQEDPGVMPGGDIYGNGAPTGITYYENGAIDDLYPEGLLLSCESARGIVFGYVPQPVGAGFSLQRFDFLRLKENSSQHGWFRPSDVAVGPDGAIYVSDWYDPGVGGHRMSDTTASGTIYRIAPKGFQSQVPRFDLASVDGQIAALSSPATHVRALGFELLKQGGPASLKPLQSLLENNNKFIAARAIWLLPYAGEDGINQVKRLLTDKDPMFRVTALRSLRRAGHNIIAHANELANDPSTMVRRELALSLRDVDWGEKQSAIKSLAAGFDGWDPWYLEAIGTAVEGNEANAYQLLVSDTTGDPLHWDRATAELAWRLHPIGSIGALTARAMSSELAIDRRKRMINAIGFIQDPKAALSMLKIATEGPEDMRGLAAWWGHNRNSNHWKSYGVGRRFPRPPKIAASKHAEGAPTLMFDPAGDAVIRTGWIEMSDGESIDVDISGAHRIYLIVDGPGKRGTKETSLADWINPVLIGPEGQFDLTKMTWMSATRVGKADAPRVGRNADRGELRVAGQHEPKGIGVQPRSVIAYDIQGQGYTRFQAYVALDQANKIDAAPVRFSIKVDRSALADTVDDVNTIVDTAGSASHGKALFFSRKLNCANCHMLDGYGGEIGPDLTQIASKHARPVLLEAILKPSAAISTGFETITILTVDGDIATGLLISGGDPIVIKDAQGKMHSFAQDEVEFQKSSEVSVMPEMKDLLTVQEAADLVDFLQASVKADHEQE
tara:strand:- start:102 stop:2372 length:2271 start_codon:yes stop_codon:yes gene_type:complete